MHSTRTTPFLSNIFLAAVATAALAFAASSEAAVIDFDQAEGQVPTGTIVFNGTTVTGSAITFGRILGDNTPFNDGSELTCTACTLSFTTGLLAGSGEVFGVTTYVFGAGGTVSLDGQVQADAGGVPPHPGTIGNIATGSFRSAALVVGPGNVFTFLSNKGITDTKDTALVEYFFGIGANVPPLSFTGSTTELGGTGTFGALGSFTSTNLTLADFANEIPETGDGPAHATTRRRWNLGPQA